MTEPGSIKHMSILWAGRDSGDELATLHAQVFSPAWDADSIGLLLDHPGAIAFKASIGGPLETAGFVLGRLAADEAEILSLGVCESWRRRGVARQLVEAFCRAARKAETRHVHLEVAESNIAARMLYKGLGFKETGRRPGYYQHTGCAAEDAINLALAL